MLILWLLCWVLTLWLLCWVLTLWLLCWVLTLWLVVLVVALAGCVSLWPTSGTPALTTRGFTAADFDKVAEFFHRGVEIAIAFNKTMVSKKLVDFKSALATAPPPELKALQDDVVAFACGFPTVGFTESTMRYKDAKV